MDKAVNLFDKALADYNAAKIIRSAVSSDEEELNVIAYLLQQSLELSAKYIMEMNGLEYPKSHDIETLHYFASENGVDLFFTEYISDHQEMFSQWESKSRYIVGYLTELSRIDAAINALGEYFKIVSEKLTQ